MQGPADVVQSRERNLIVASRKLTEKCLDAALPSPALKFLDTLRPNVRVNSFRRRPGGICVKILVHLEGYIFPGSTMLSITTFPAVIQECAPV